FLPALKFADYDTTYTGIQLITGTTVFDIGPVADGKLPFSILALLAFGLPIVAGLIFVSNTKGSIISVILFIISAILLFILPEYTIINVTTFIGGTSEWEADWVLQTGAIIAGVLSSLGAIVGLFGMSKIS
ncbi:MAG: hypothetical protein WCR19_05270, partial [Acholeplasmataceae bacterium]